MGHGGGRRDSFGWGLLPDLSRAHWGKDFCGAGSGWIRRGVTKLAEDLTGTADATYN